MSARRTRWKLLGLLTLGLTLAWGCGNGVDPEPSVESTEEAGLVERAAKIALEIEADPDATEQILERHGLTVEAFDEMMLQISQDEELRRAYNARLEG